MTKDMLKEYEAWSSDRRLKRLDSSAEAFIEEFKLREMADAFIGIREAWLNSPNEGFDEELQRIMNQFDAVVGDLE